MAEEGIAADYTLGVEHGPWVFENAVAQVYTNESASAWKQLEASSDIERRERTTGPELTGQWRRENQNAGKRA